MKKLGAVLVDPADIPTSGKFDDSEFEVLLYEFKADLNAYLAGLGPQAPVHSLKDVIEFNEKNRDREMPYFGQDIMIKAQAKGPLTSKAYLQALRKNHLLTRSQGIDFVMKKHRLDALVAPTGGPSWPTDWINGDHFTRWLFVGVGSRRISAHHRSGGLRFWSAGWNLVLRRRLQRAEADQDRLRFRAGHEGAPPTEVFRKADIGYTAFFIKLRLNESNDKCQMISDMI